MTSKTNFKALFNSKVGENSIILFQLIIQQIEYSSSVDLSQKYADAIHSDIL